MLYIAALSLLLVSLGHSYLGEKILLRPLFATYDFSAFKNSRDFARNVLRAGWHLLTLTWIGLALVLLNMQIQAISFADAFLAIMALMFTAFGFGALIFSRGRHLSWIFFFITSACCAATLFAP